MAETRFSRAISECERYLSQIQNYGKTPRRLAAGRKRRQSGVDIEEVPDVYVSEQPDLMENGELQTHQYDGLNWLLQLYRIGLNGILGDEMGVGKTIQTIALFAYLKQQTPRKLRHLVVGPKSVLNNWGHEFAYWAPSMKVMVMPGTKEERNEILKNLPKDLDVLITTFEGARLTSDKLRKINWEYLILDEAHKIKNTESLLRASLNDIPTKRRVLLTGTPIQNNLSELFSLLEFIAPHLFSKKQDFLEGIDLIEDQEGAADRLRKILGPLMLRRTKADLDLPIPPYKEVHIPIRLNEVELNWYKVIIKHEMMKYCMNDHKNMMMQLRKICLHPYMFQELEPEGLPDFGEHLIQASSKLSVLDLLVQKIHVEGEKLIIFSQFVLLLDILEDYCTLRGYGFVRLDGSSTLEERDHGMHAFQNDPETFIYLVSTRAGGLGINLTAASNVIFYDSDWNPQMDLQAIARAHRIGQKKNLMVYRLVQSKTIEENIINLQVHKLKLDHLVCNDKSSSLLKRKEAVQLISGNLEELLYEGTKPETRDIAQLIEDGKNKFIELQKRIEGQSLQEFIQKQEEAPDLELPAVLKDEVKQEKRQRIRIAFDKPKPVVQIKDYSKIYKWYNLYDDRDLLIKLSGKNDIDELDPDRLERLQELKASGFDWTMDDWRAFKDAVLEHGKDATKQIAKATNKCKEEIIAYSEKLWQVADLYQGARGLVNALKRQQARKEQIEVLDELLRNAKSPNSWKSMDLPLSNNKIFTSQVDAMLLILTKALGYGEWEAIWKKATKHPDLKFNYEFRVQPMKKIQARICSLLDMAKRRKKQNANFEAETLKRKNREEVCNDVKKPKLS